jgi:hypothetical protein
MQTELAWSGMKKESPQQFVVSSNFLLPLPRPRIHLLMSRDRFFATEKRTHIMQTRAARRPQLRGPILTASTCGAQE